MVAYFFQFREHIVFINGYLCSLNYLFWKVVFFNFLLIYIEKNTTGYFSVLTKFIGQIKDLWV